MFKKLIFIFILNFLIEISKSTTLPGLFNVIGPFTIGEREETFDSLESYGGIFSIPIGDNTTYPSEFGHNGVVGWRQFNSSIPGQLEIDWSDTIDWSFYDTPFGWEIYLWYAYAVGDFQSTEGSNYIVNCNSARTFYIQTLSSVPGTPSVIKEFTGDFYSYGNGQNIVSLEAGQNYRFYVKMISSTRDNLSPLGKFACQLTPVPIYQVITLIETESLVPDIVGTILASPYGSITVINSGNSDLFGISVVLANSSLSLFNLNISNSANGNGTFNILVGQRLSMSFEIEIKSDSTQLECPMFLELNLVGNSTIILNNINIPFNCSSFESPYLFTFLDFDNTVQYAMAIPPINTCGNSSELCNIMLATHGANVVAADPSWTSVLPRQNNLWVLAPTGRTPWGYDWGSSSRLNVFNAIDALVTQLPGVPLSQKSLYKTDGTKIIFIGHSMGGMGCWSLLSRQGDLALGGACASGFSKLELYLLYDTAPGFAYIDQTLKGILMSSIEENNVDLISSNLVGLPLMARYGENDTVVNPYHSRRIVRMVSEQSQNETAVMISEEPNANHWFNGILNDSFMQNFYNILASNNQYLPDIPKTITISTLNPASSGSRANILILQQKQPFRISKIKLTQVYEKSQLVWIIETSNVRRFAITQTPIRQQFPVELIIDGSSFNNNFFYPDYHFENTKDNTNKKYWTLSNDNSTWIENERNPLTNGPIRQIFEKNFKIIYGTIGQGSATAQLKQGSVYINNFWNNYGRGSAPIFSDVDYIPIYSNEVCSENQNLILLGSSYQNLFTEKLIERADVSFNIDNSFTLDKSYEFSTPGSGITFIIPNSCGKGLVLVVAGIDSVGFENALHSLPKRSGEVSPDFLIVGPEYRGKGYGGILSAGYWSNNFTLSPQSFYTSTI
ncbi:hypothetical protein DICPUDRAFT_40286 [Dictyostelium purpureum]|uniref:Peptidase S9 prolyl oligopeptidase catalytic domain-containing protein n=1 Tax=Dictyostelium purpureum TaxID=5786 RepID=F0ZXY5_DICPU|nr:uncharacterized protein DICPUDRAFT_40286 [Dictyostelium purpureum]EGC31189.1 hypothetical protein DICPUDRAFT_40286 [Dictyostelium purpureum]|eukprot:XP_003292278.1 hypothetical protein DICPUDRAFT_40286 [Dictyostelium purpureum]